MPSISASMTTFSKDAQRPPSSQPAACFTKLVWARRQGHRDIWDSYADCASGALDALTLEER